MTIQFMVTGPLPKEVVVALGIVIDPFCTVPVVKVAVVPLTVSAYPPMSSVPLVSLKLLIAVLALKTQVLLPVTMVTWSVAPGIPLGVQLVGVFQLVEEDPFQVYVVWAFSVLPRKRVKSRRKYGVACKGLFIEKR